MRKSDITKQKILSAAEAVFAEKGLHGARVDEISLLSGVNKRMIYAYFESKENLYSSVLTEVYSRMSEFEAAIDIPLPAERAIKLLTAAYFDFLDKNPSFVKLVMWENLNKATYIDFATVAPIKSAAVDTVRSILQNGRHDKIFKRDIDDKEIIFALNMFCFSYYSNMYTFPKIIKIDLSDKSLTKKRSDMVAEMIIEYLKAD